MLMSTIALHSTLNISETVIEIEASFQRTTNRKCRIWAIKWSRDRWRHVTPKGAIRQYGRLS